MPQSVAIILQRLTQTLYDLKNRVFINTAIVKYNTNVVEAYQKFSKALLSWYSTNKDGSDVVADRTFILLFKHTDIADYSSGYLTSISAIERFLSQCKNFYLDISDFSTSAPVSLQRYYVFGYNSLKVLQHQQTNSNLNGQAMALIRCEAGYINENAGIEQHHQYTIDYSENIEVGVCKNKCYC